MNEKMIEQLNKEKEEKSIFCEINDHLFNADLMRGITGEIYRSITLNKLY